MKLINILLLILFSCANNAFSQNLLYENVAPVAAHERRVSSHVFPKSGATLSSNSLDSKGSQNVLSQVISYVVFTPSDPETYEKDKAAILYSMPDKCTESKVVMDEVFHHTEGSEKLDLLIYDMRDPEQVRKAKNFNTATTPWDPTYDMSAGYETIDAKMQDLARVMAPNCLPARYRFVYVGSKRYNEIRYGDKAWER